jgi:hypothetical protein
MHAALIGCKLSAVSRLLSGNNQAMAKRKPIIEGVECEDD